jgi:hypothetical protein
MWDWKSESAAGPSNTSIFLIVEKIDAEKASLYFWREGFMSCGEPLDWEREEAMVRKVGGNYELSYHAPRCESVTLSVTGNRLRVTAGGLTLITMTRR